MTTKKPAKKPICRIKYMEKPMERLLDRLRLGLANLSSPANNMVKADQNFPVKRSVSRTLILQYPSGLSVQSVAKRSAPAFCRYLFSCSDLRRPVCCIGCLIR
ncbi:unnamed protein product [Dovyalis caffra]|uniref:Uncharacterized protein n=1 Tax=Dovyalis caffra TaxID=77055 RepID=A0AAV1RTM3_9ROSI|nr:unnamed protein product [Dovyalis caffra]